MKKTLTRKIDEHNVRTYNSHLRSDGVYICVHCQKITDAENSFSFEGYALTCDECLAKLDENLSDSVSQVKYMGNLVKKSNPVELECNEFESGYMQCKKDLKNFIERGFKS